MSLFRLFTICLLASCSSIAADRFEPITLTAEVPNKEKHCFYERFNIGAAHVFSYKLLRGGPRDFVVTVHVHSENQSGSAAKTVEQVALYKKSEFANGQFSIPQEDGIYAFCFLNDFPRQNYKVVSFSLSALRGEERAPEYALLDDYLKRLSRILKGLLDHQLKRTVLDGHRYETAMKLNDFVMWWSLIEMCAFFVLGLGQLFVLKMLFTVSSVAENGSHPVVALRLVN